MKKLFILILMVGLFFVVKPQECDKVELDLFMKKVTQDIKLEYFELNKQDQELFIKYLNQSNNFFRGYVFMRIEAALNKWAKICGLESTKEIMDKNPKFQNINYIYGASISEIFTSQKNVASSCSKIIQFNNFIRDELKELKLPIVSKL
jgi:hypothetical protein